MNARREPLTIIAVLVAIVITSLLFASGAFVWELVRPEISGWLGFDGLSSAS